jgi:hypothetical protein
MHFSLHYWRTLLKVGSLATVWLFCASSAWAAPGHHKRTRIRVCDQRTHISLRNLATHPPVGPVAPPSTRAQSGLADPTLFFQRGHRAVLDDDVAVISNEAPVAQIDADLSLTPDFESLGILARTADQLPLDAAFLPRSPRGPPFTA